MVKGKAWEREWYPAQDIKGEEPNMEEKAVARIYEIRATRKALEAEEKALLADLKNLEIDDYAVGPFLVKVQPNRRFDATLAAQVIEDLPEHKQRKVLKRVVDRALLEAHYPDLFPLAQRESAPKIVVEIPND